MSDDLVRDPTFRGLMAAILEDPEDDVPRLVLADWLDDHAEAAHDRLGAGVIRRQCADRDWQPWDDDGPYRGWYMEQTKWVRRLFDAPSCGMIDPRPEGYVGIAIDRGFVGELAVTQEQWLAAGPAVVRMAPVRRVVLADCVPHWSHTPAGRKAALFRRLVTPVQWPHEIDNRLWPFIDAGAKWTNHMALYDTPAEALDDAGRAALAWARRASRADYDLAVAFARERLAAEGFTEVDGRVAV